MAFALIARWVEGGAGIGNFTTTAIDTSGADFLVVASVGYTAAEPPTDSKSNSSSDAVTQGGSGC